MRACKTIHRNRRPVSYLHQRGIAALLIILLTGLSATVVTLGAMSYVKGAKDSQLVVHGQTQAEIKVWAAVNALGQYLNRIPVATVTESLGTVTFTESGDGGTEFASAQYMASCSNLTSNLYCFQVTGSSAGNNTTLQIVYQIPVVNIVNTSQVDRTLIFHGDVDISGGGFGTYDKDGVAEIAVDGDLSVSGGTSTISAGGLKIDTNNMEEWQQMIDTGGAALNSQTQLGIPTAIWARYL